MSLDSLMPFETTFQFGFSRVSFSLKDILIRSLEYGGYVGVSQSEEPEHELSVAMVIYLPTCAKTSWKVAGQKLQPQLLQLHLSKGQVTI